MPRTPQDEEALWPTKWKSAQRGEHFMVKAKDFNPPPSLGQRVTGRFYDEEDNEVKEVSVPQSYYEKWIDTAGNVRAVPMKTTSVMEDPVEGVFADQGPYYHQVTAEMYQAGWLHYEKGKQGEDPGEWLSRRDEELAKRRTKQNKAMNSAERKYMDGKKAKEAETQAALLKAFEGISAQMEKRSAAAAAEMNAPQDPASVVSRRLSKQPKTDE